MATALTCTECEELVALAALGVLGRAEAAGMEVHLRGCARCRDTSRAFQRTALSLSESVDLLEPAPELRQRLLAAVYSSGTSVPRTHRLLRTLWGRIPQSRAFTVLAAVAAAAAIAFAVWAARAPAPQPLAQTYPVKAAAGALSARGELIYYPSTARSVLTVAGLPAPPGTSVYEVWLISSAGSPQPVALLSRAPGGSRWTAVVLGDVLRYKTLATTVEPPGGTPRPTGPQVFSVDFDGV